MMIELTQKSRFFNNKKIEKLKTITTFKKEKK